MIIPLTLHLILANNCTALPVASPGQLCDRGQLCTGGAICDSADRVCSCAAHHLHRRGLCVHNSTADEPKTAALGEECPTEMETAKISETEPKGNKTVDVGKKNGGVCESGGVCDRKKRQCECPTGTKAEDGYCSRISDRPFFRTPRALPFAHLHAERCPGPDAPWRCALPDCFCSRDGRQSPLPAGTPLAEHPQIVVLTFDDPVNDRSMSDYLHVFNDLRPTSSNGCPAKGTFFVSHEWTNYNEVEWIAAAGHELASNSITHRILSDANYTEWLVEMDGQRRILGKFANVAEDQVLGMRAPQLGAGGDIQYLMARTAGFLYDNTLGADPGPIGPPFYPQTLDFSLPFHCENEHCPRASIPGFWTVPMNTYHGRTPERRSSMLQGMLSGEETVEEAFALLKRNFDRAYLQNRAPFVMNFDADFFQAYNGLGMKATAMFFAHLQQLPDIQFMTLRQMVDWMRSPRSLSQMRAEAAADCAAHSYAVPMAPLVCAVPNKCLYATPRMSSREHQFLTCNQCPALYPWIDNPLGVLY